MKYLNPLKIFLVLALTQVSFQNLAAAEKAPEKVPDRVPDKAPEKVQDKALEAPDAIKKFLKLKQSSKITDAIEYLSEKLKVEADPEKKALESFLVGYSLFQQLKDKEALNFLAEAVKAKSKIEDYALFYQGLAQRRLTDFSSAKLSFKQVLESRASASIMVESKYNLGLIALEEGRFNEAELQFNMILSKWKGTEKFPEVLWKLMRVQKSLHKNICKSAREIYSKYPTYIEAKSWGHKLSVNLFEAKSTGCIATAKEEQMRIKYLQLGGEVERALEELKLLRADMIKSSSLKPKLQIAKVGAERPASADNGDNLPIVEDEDEPLTGLYSVDSMIASVLISQGKADEAFKLLLGYYEQQNRRPGYLQLLAKAAGRLGEYQAAASAFDKIYRLSPKSKSGKNALFQAAFLSYQFQDYDGASRKFDEFVKNFSDSALTRDSQWHLAWLKYLKGDYSGAYDGFQKISVMKSARYQYVRVGHRKKKHRKRIEVPMDSVTIDRAKYWMAMSLFRQEKFDQSRVLLEALSHDSSIGYYSVASYYRLQNFPQSKTGITNVSGPLAKGQNALASPPSALLLGAVSGAAAGVNPVVEAEASVGEDMQAQETTTIELPGAAQTAPAEESTNGNEELNEKILSGNFRDPQLEKRFERAQLLSQIGLNDLSKLELSEIEKHIRSPQDRKQLMEQYQVVQSYFRSSYLGEVSFSGERIRAGIAGARPLWEYAYPRAYDNFVSINSKSLGVSESLIWGIMRSESHYRSEARSPVGALGLMQLMPFTSKRVADLLGLRDFQVDTLLQPETNIKLGTRYLLRLHEKYRFVPLVAAAYNAGPHRVASWLKSFGLLDMDEFIEHIPYVETRNYVKRVVRNYQIYTLLYTAKSSSSGYTLKWLVKPVDVKVPDGNSSLEVW